MKRLIAAAFAAALIAAPAAVTPLAAQGWQHDRHDRGYDDRGDNRYGWRGDNDRRWDPSGSYRYDRRSRSRRLGRDDYVYRGNDGRYYCKRNDGTTGLVIGALGGGLLGNAIGGDTLGTILGAGAGGLLGRSIDRGNVKCR